MNDALDKRRQRLGSLAAEHFDVLVIGGGATGTGTALDAASRGLKVALVERYDFAEGTSSRSTKLVHGGVRYLEQAVRHADRSQFNLVREALHERAILLKNAPHLAHPLPLLTPIYGTLELPYYFTGLKLYDMLAGKANLESSRLIGKGAAVKRFPMLRHKGLRGAVEYHDGQFDDARMNVSLALTAAANGAVILNHAEVRELTKRGGKISGAVINDRLEPGAPPLEISAKVVVNATGPFADAIRRLDEPSVEELLNTSSGVHVVLPARFSPANTGLLIPKTEDGRVLFLLPWLGHTLVGTTDNPAAVEAHPQASENDIEYILRHVRQYFDLPVAREDVLSAWSGLRPLVEPHHDGEAASSTARLSRDHTIITSESGLITVTGGKWTTYRKMSQDTVDVALEVGKLEPQGASTTEDLPLVGASGFEPDAFERLARSYSLPNDVARHLHRAYGSLAPVVIEQSGPDGKQRLAPEHPFIEAEVSYARDHEYACNADDVLARRLRLTFLDSAASAIARPRVEELLGLPLAV